MYPRCDIYEFPDDGLVQPGGASAPECTRTLIKRMVIASGAEIREDRALLGRREMRIFIKDEGVDTILNVERCIRPTRKNV